MFQSKKPQAQGQPDPAHAQAMTSAGCEPEVAAQVMAAMPASGLTLTQILDLARRVPWLQVLAFARALASGDKAAIIAAVMAIFGELVGS